VKAKRKQATKYFVNIRPIGTNIFRSTHVFKLLREAREFSSSIDVGSHDFVIKNEDGKAITGNTYLMREYRRRRKVMANFIDRGGDCHSNTFKSIRKEVEDIRNNLMESQEFLVTMIDKGVII